MAQRVKTGKSDMSNYREVVRFEEKNIPSILKLCNNHMEYDTLTEELLREKVFYDPAYPKGLSVNLIYKESNQPLGFLSGVIRDTEDGRIGYVKLMVVHTNHRRKGIGTLLYQKAEDFFLNQGAREIRVYDVPFNYFMPGIDPRYTPAISFFETLGFKRFSDTANMIVELEDKDFNTKIPEQKLEKEGILISRARPEERAEILDFIRKNFPHWVIEVSNAFKFSPIPLHIARYRGRIKAFAAHNCNNFNTGWFGPMGTHTSMRGKGAGGVLLKRCLNDMKETGLKKTTIPWVGPIRFYSYHVNAVVNRVFWRYRKHF